jgi:AcrR family transcriptional regulator
MSSEENAARERIISIAKEEFLSKGFRETSLRNIVKSAGVSTGSFYWHFENKEQLFDAVVKEHYEHILQMYEVSLSDFFKQSNEEQLHHMGDIGGECMLRMYKYMHKHKTEFMILINGSSGTKYENMLHELTEREITSTHRFQEQMKERGLPKKQMSSEMEHIITSGMFAGLLELITHDIPYRKGLKCVQELHDFYTAGFAYAMGLPLPDSMQDK